MRETARGRYWHPGAAPPEIPHKELDMAISHRSYHLHVSKWRHRRNALRWSVTRSLWGVGEVGQSAVLASGTVEVEVDGGTTHEQAYSALMLALLAYRAELDAMPPRGGPTRPQR